MFVGSSVKVRVRGRGRGRGRVAGEGVREVGGRVKELYREYSLALPSPPCKRQVHIPPALLVRSPRTWQQMPAGFLHHRSSCEGDGVVAQQAPQGFWRISGKCLGGRILRG